MISDTSILPSDTRDESGKHLRKTKAQLIKELEELERQVADGQRASVSNESTEKEALLREAVDYMHGGICMLDSDLNIVFFNEQYKEFYGFPDGLVEIGKSIEVAIRYSVERGFHGPGDVEEQIALRMAVLRSHEDSEVDRQLPNGRSLHLSHKAVPGAGFVTIVTDITDHKAAEVALKESERRLLEAQRIAGLGNWEWNIVDNIIWWSDEIYRMFELEPQSFSATYEAFLESVHPNDREFVDTTVKESLASKVPYRIEYRMLLPSGEIRTVAEQTELTIGGESQVIQMVGTILDITERVLAEEARRLALVEAEQANHAKSEFLATMSHELRTPLNAISGFSEMLIGQVFGALGSPKYKEYADDIHTSSEHLLHLVNDILDLSAIEAGKQPMAKESLDVYEVIKDCSPIVVASTDRKGITYSVEVPVNSVPLYADRRALKQILLNVLSNAVKFTPEGGRVTLKATTSNDSYVFEVSDTGEGISEDKLPSLTDPFVRTETDPHKAQEGTGLGLAITKSLVDLHDGELAIESEVGKGTVVTVVLPSGVS